MIYDQIVGVNAKHITLLANSKFLVSIIKHIVTGSQALLRGLNCLRAKNLSCCTAANKNLVEVF